MKLLRERLYCVCDTFDVQRRLDAIYRNHVKLGNKVERSLVGIVILKLDNGEVHFVPGDGKIMELVFQYVGICR